MKKRRFRLYVVMDMSESMTRPMESKDPQIKGKIPFDVAMDIVPSIIDTVINKKRDNPSDLQNENTVVSSALRISVIGFHQTAFSLLAHPKTGVDPDIETKNIQILNSWWNSVNKASLRKSCGGQTYYSVLFDKLCEWIKRDQKKYDPAAYELGRPVVYFLTDGHPEGNYETMEKVNAAYDKLVSETDHKAPIIVVIGIGNDVTEENIGKYGAGRVTAKWEYDPEKGKRVKKYSPDGPYRTHNQNMSFILKGNSAVKVLPPLNKKVIESIMNSISNRNTRGPIPRYEPDFGEAFRIVDAIMDNEEMI